MPCWLAETLPPFDVGGVTWVADEHTSNLVWSSGEHKSSGEKTRLAAWQAGHSGEGLELNKQMRIGGKDKGNIQKTDLYVAEKIIPHY